MDKPTIPDAVIERGLREFEVIYPADDTQDAPTAPAVTECLNDQCEGHNHRQQPGSNRCYCGARKWIKTRYQRHQNGRERIRRLRQISRDQLQGGVSPAAQEMARLIALNIAVSHAELACSEYVRDAQMYENERIGARMALLSAVSELARFLRGEPAYASATTSALLRTVDSAPSGNGDNDLAVA